MYAGESLKLRVAARRLPRARHQTDCLIEASGPFLKTQDQLDDTREEELAVIKAQIDPLKWMNGIVIAGVLALTVKTFFA
jgi:hypothetical protein